MKKLLQNPIKLILFLTFFIMFIFNIFVPLISDDFSYSFSCADNTRIISISQIIDSLVVHRQAVNGRLVAHFFVYLFRAFPDMVFNIFNAMNAAFLVWISYRYYRSGRHVADAITALFGIFLVWIFTPVFGDCFLWCAGSINYSWGASFMLIFLLPFVGQYLGKGTDIPLALKILFIPFSFLVGAYSESISSATIFIAFFILLFITINRKHVDILLTVMLLAAACGYLFLISSPATRNVQFGGFSISAVVQNFRNILITIKETIFPLYILYAILFVLNIKTASKRIMILSAIFVAASLFEYFALSFGSTHGLRPLFISCFYLAFACQLLFSELFRSDTRFAGAIFSAALVVFLFNFVIGTIDLGALYLNSCARDEEIRTAKDSGERIVYLTPYYPSSKYSPVTREDLDEDPNVWPNGSIAYYYDFDSVFKK